MWTIDGSTVSFDTIWFSLATCFGNFDASSWEKQFKVKYFCVRAMYCVATKNIETLISWPMQLTITIRTKILQRTKWNISNSAVSSKNHRALSEQFLQFYDQTFKWKFFFLSHTSLLSYFWIKCKVSCSMYWLAFCLASLSNHILWLLRVAESVRKSLNRGTFPKEFSTP